MTTVTVTCACGCGQKFEARVADRQRGWGCYLNKSHKAKAQERRTGQHRAYLERAERRDEGGFDADSEAAGHIFGSGYFGHGQN
jgi:hypothetical protein